MIPIKTFFLGSFRAGKYIVLFLFLWLTGVTACTNSHLAESDFCPPINIPSLSDNATLVTVSTPSSRWNCWNLQIFQIAAAQHPELNVVIVEPKLVPLEGELTTSVSEDFSAGIGPDIFRASLSEIWRLQQSNVISPLTDCVEKHQEQFQQIPVEFWEAVTLNGEIWAVPIAFEPDLLFFNKVLLQELGWSDEEIDTLPERIAQGQFLFDDMLETATAAENRGIIASGNGYWPRLSGKRTVDLNYLSFGGTLDHLQGEVLQISQSIMTDVLTFRQEIAESNLIPPGFEGHENNDWSVRIARRDAVAAGRVLFWENHLSEIANYYYNYSNSGERFTDIYGVASLPVHQTGKTSYVNLSLRGLVIGSVEATGRNNQSIACDLLAHTLIPEVLAQYSVSIMQLPTLPEAYQLPTLQQHALLSEVLDASTHFYLFYDTPDKMLFREIAIEYFYRVERGEIPPEEGTIALMAELKSALGDGFRMLP